MHVGDLSNQRRAPTRCSTGQSSPKARALYVKHCKRRAKLVPLAEGCHPQGTNGLRLAPQFCGWWSPRQRLLQGDQSPASSTRFRPQAVIGRPDFVPLKQPVESLPTHLRDGLRRRLRQHSGHFMALRMGLGPGPRLDLGFDGVDRFPVVSCSLKSFMPAVAAAPAAATNAKVWCAWPCRRAARHPGRPA